MADGDRQARDAWVLRVLGVDVSAAGPGALAAALARWQAARGSAMDQLGALERVIRGTGDARGDAAIILVRAIMANLTASPGSTREATELRRYLDTDDIIGDAELPNGLGVTVNIRVPLSAALADVEAALAA